MVGHSGRRYWAIKSWLPACYWVRRHGDGTFFFTSILLLYCNYLPSLPPSSPFTTTSIPSCPKHRESECASLLLLFCFYFFFSFPFYFHWRYQRRTNLFLFSDEPHLHRPQGVSRRYKGWRRSVRKKESRNLRLELEIELFMCLFITMSKFAQYIRLFILLVYVSFLLLFVLSV